MTRRKSQKTMDTTTKTIGPTIPILSIGKKSKIIYPEHETSKKNFKDFALTRYFFLEIHLFYV